MYNCVLLAVALYLLCLIHAWLKKGSGSGRH